jgi:hypothetical protein
MLRRRNFTYLHAMGRLSIEFKKWDVSAMDYHVEL